MRVEFASRKVGKIYAQYKKIYPTRRAAFRAAKRDRNIPMSAQPDDIVYPRTAVGDAFGLDDRNVRLYVFNLVLVALVVHIREDKEVFYVEGDDDSNQLPHFNSGRAGKKLRDHHYWRK